MSLFRSVGHWGSSLALPVFSIVSSLAFGCAPAEDDPAADDGATDDTAQDGGGGAGGSSGTPSLCGDVECGYHEGCVVEGETPTCACLPGFSGEGCEEDVNECLEASACGAAEACLNTVGGYSCLCGDDSVATASGCAAIDECGGGSTGCAASATCEDTEGAPPTCTCPGGKFGDGSFCLTSDPCAGVDCNGGTCVPTPEGALCDCPAGTSGAHCQDGSSCADIAFGSPELEIYVRASSNVFDGPLDAAELELTALSVTATTDPLVDDLSGLECLVTLESLAISGQSVTSLAPLAQLSRLESLVVTCTPVVDLAPLAALIRLSSLGLGGGACVTEGQITSLEPLSGLTNLESLDISRQPVASLDPLANLPGLVVLVADGLDATDFSALGQLTRLRELSLSGSTGFELDDALSLPNLRRLGLSDTGLTTLAGIAAKTSLREVDVSDNQLESLAELELPPALYSLDASNNQVQTLAGLRVPKGTAWLNLWGNELDDAEELLDLELPPGLELWLFDNPFACESAVPVFEQLEARGVAVLHDCPLP